MSHSTQYGKIRLGIDILRASGFKPLKGLRVGAICNITSVDGAFDHLADLLQGAPGVELGALFGPEHGVRGEAQDMVGVKSAPDPVTKIPVHSLYGATFESLSPTEQALAGLDALVFDIQDVGSRYYTYIYTMALAMRAAAQRGIAFYVLDRPNPINGIDLEGNIVHPGFESFVGLYPLPNRHGMTAGELAVYFNQVHGIGCDLHVIPCEGWKREMWWEDTGRAFIPPSPNMPTVDTACVYPGLCFIEGTNMSEGRGTTRPFEWIGAPYLDPPAFAAALEAENLPGIAFRADSFRPTFQKHAGTTCGGVMLHVTDRRAFLPVRTGIAILRAARQTGGDAFRWRTEKYEFIDDKPAIDLLTGTDSVRLAIDAGKTLDQCMEGFDRELSEFAGIRRRFLLY